MGDEVRARVHDQFERAAPAWENWSAVFAERDDALRYVEAAKVGTGDRVLEIGAGTGDQTLVVAERVGPRGRVLATDLSAGMLDVARRRIDAAGLGNVEFRETAIEDLDVEPMAFDAAVSGFTWLFLPDPVRAAASVRDALVPGGRFAASVWGPTPQMPTMAVAASVIVPALGVDPREEIAGGTPDLNDPETFRSVFIDAEFDDVTVTAFTVRMSWSSAEDYAASVRDLAPPLSDLIAGHAPEQADELWSAVADAARRHAARDGTVTLENLAYMGAGTKVA